MQASLRIGCDRKAASNVLSISLIRVRDFALLVATREEVSEQPAVDVFHLVTEPQ